MTNGCAKGLFTVKITPLPTHEDAVAEIAGMALSKTFEGDMCGHASGHMLALGTPVDGSAVYVALDRFQGSVDGHAGGFDLHHRGVMHRGVPSLEIAIVPDSGSGALLGISGMLKIDIVEGKHFYQLDYQLGETAG